MQYRKLGQTGSDVSIIGLGGVVVMGMPQAQANDLVAEAIDRGVNYFDVAPGYRDAEDRLGEALKGKRDKVFLACKTTMRTRDEAARELETSLTRLQTDHLDSYQFHGLDDPDELATALGPGGALEVFEAARAAGKIRHIGITGHSVENLSRALQSYSFDTVLFPVNFAQFEMANYGPELLELARSKGVGRLAIKPVAQGPWAEDEEHTCPNCWYKPLSEKRLFELALRYALSQDITTAMPAGDHRLFRMALDVAENFRPLDESELQELRNCSEQFSPLWRHVKV